MGAKVVVKHHPWMGGWNKERDREQIYVVLPEAYLPLSSQRYTGDRDSRYQGDT